MHFDVMNHRNFVIFGCLLPLLVLLIAGIVIAFWFTFIAGTPDKIEESDVPAYVSTFDKSVFCNKEAC